MTPEQWVLIGRVYEAALEHSEAERASFIKNACGSDDELRTEVESLMVAQKKAGEFLQRNAAADLLVDGLNRPPPLVGTRLLHYQLLSLLGAGGMGEVYHALDTRLMRHAAVKVLPSSFATDRERLRRFEHEAQTVSGLNHPNIVTVYETGETEYGRFLAMELVEGETLRHIIQSRPPSDSVTRMGLQIAEALKVAHAAQIVHRDIKPENLMLRHDGYIKVLDFGLARLLPPIAGTGLARTDGAELSKTGTQPGMILGTARYMSPEQARGMEVTSASDIFSLGVVLYELSTGQHPFRASTQFGTLDAILSETPLLPSRVNGNISAECDELVLWMLDKRPETRPDAGEVQRALAEMAGRNQQLARPDSSRYSKITVGRSREHERLHALWASATAAHGSFCCIAGEPGIGKTTLVEDFLATLATTNGSRFVARGRCSERSAGTEAYSPFLEALDDLYRCSESVSEVLRQRAPTWYRQVASYSSDAISATRPVAERAYSQERFKRELASFVQELSRRQPFILFLEDLHWADLSTVDLLAFLTERIGGSRVMIIGTYRTSELGVSGHPFMKVKQDLQARALAEEIRLDFLSRGEIGRYVDLQFPRHRLPPEVADLVHAKTEGNPLFMTDLLRYFRESGIVQQDRNEWVLARALPEVERELPPSIQAMIDRMIGQLESEDRRLLVAASVQGNEFDSAVISRALALDEATVEEQLNVLAKVHGLVSLVEEHEFPGRALSLRFRFTHVLYHNALYATLAPARRAALSNSVADALETLYGGQSAAVAAVLARLFEIGRRFMPAAERYLQAAKSAGRIFAANEAAQLARQGLAMIALIPKGSERDQVESSLQLELGNALLVVLGYGAPEVEEFYGRAYDLSHQVGQSPQVLPILYGLWVSNLIHGRLERALGFGEDFLDVARRVTPEAILVGERMVACPHFYLGRLAESRPYFEQSISRYDPMQHRAFAWLYGQEPGLTAHSYLGWIFWLSGYPAQAAEHTRQSLKIGREVEHALSRCHSLFFAAVHAHLVHDWKELRVLTDELFLYSHERKAVFWIDAAEVLTGLLATKDGNGLAGIANMRRVVESLAAADIALCVPILYRFVAEAYAEVRDFDSALAAMDSAMQLSDRTLQFFYQPELYRYRGELLIRQGGQLAFPTAEDMFRKALDMAREQSAKSWELRAALSLSELLLEQGRRAEAVELLQPLCGWFTEARETGDLRKADTLLRGLR